MRSLLLVLIFSPIFSRAQPFDLADSSFQVGYIFSPKIVFDFDAETISSASQPLLDSIAFF
jgi:hypothetical protein